MLVGCKISSNFAAAKVVHGRHKRKTLFKTLQKQDMIIVPIKDGENIERALKKFKRKFERTGVTKELRARQQFVKPSVKKRLKMEHAVYVQKLRDAEQ